MSLELRIKQEVEKKGGVAAVWFNAWQYEKEEHLIVPLVATINKELERTWPGKIAKGAKDIQNALRAIIYGFSIKGKVGIPLISETEVSLLPKEMIARYQELTKDSVLARSLYFDAFEELKKCAQGSAAPRIVVFVDDLDRCFPNKAVDLLEGIKLVLHQPGFSFVLGLNEVIIEAFIKTKYKKDYDIEGSHFDDYLDKMVQVKIPVPKRTTGDMQEYIGHLLDEGKVFAEDVKRDAIPLIADACRHNPRSIVRLLNRIIVASRIAALEGMQHDPVLLLIHLATDEPRYLALRNALDVNVIIKGDPETNVTIGQYLAEELHQFQEKNHYEWVGRLRNTQLRSMQDVLNRAVEIFEKNEHLWSLLKSDIGRQWLSDSVFRGTLNKASESTLGEKKAVEETPREIPAGLADLIGGLQGNMVRIPAGTFMMGSEENDSEKPVHEVTLSAFEISATPVTQAQYEAVMGDNPSHFKDPDNPVENVSWDDAMKFCEKLKQRTGQEFMLPSEAQWEYACRAGSSSKYCFGDAEEELGDYAWYDKNSEGRTHPAGRKKPNAWGLYDMHGNVWEWCQDWWADNYASDAVSDP